MNTDKLHLILVKGSLEIYKEYIVYGLIFYYTRYWWKVIGSNAPTGPFASIPLAVLNYETYLLGTAKIPETTSNVIKVDFYNKIRAR